MFIGKFGHKKARLILLNQTGLKNLKRYD